MGSIRKQGISNTIITYIGVLIGFVNILVIQPQMLSPEELGLTRILTSTSIIFGTLFPMGLNGVMIKYFPAFRNRENGNYGFPGLVLMTALVSYLVFGIAFYLLKDFWFARYEKSPLFIEYFTYVFPLSLFVGFISVFNGYGFCLFKSTVPSFLDEIFNRLFIMTIVCLYFIKLIDFHSFITLFVCATGVQLLILAFYISLVDKISFRVNWSFIRSKSPGQMMSYVFMIALATLASRALRQIDVVMVGSDLSKSSPLDEVAIYTIAFTIGSLIEVPANALSKIGDSKISDAIHRNDFKLIETIYYRSTRILMVVGGLLMTGVYIDIHSLLYYLPEKYASGETVVKIIGVSAFFNMATGLNSSMIYYSDKYRQGTYLLVGLIFTSILLNWLLIPHYGIEGAAIATGTALLLFNAVKTLIIWRSFRMQPFGKYVWGVFFLIGLCLGVNHFLPELENRLLDMCYRSAVITLIYGTGTLLMKILPEANEFVRKRIGINL